MRANERASERTKEDETSFVTPRANRRRETKRDRAAYRPAAVCRSHPHRVRPRDQQQQRAEHRGDGVLVPPREPAGEHQLTNRRRQRERLPPVRAAARGQGVDLPERRRDGRVALDVDHDLVGVRLGDLRRRRRRRRRAAAAAAAASKAIPVSHPPRHDRVVPPPAPVVRVASCRIQRGEDGVQRPPRLPPRRVVHRDRGAARAVPRGSTGIATLPRRARARSQRRVRFRRDPRSERVPDLGPQVLRDVFERVPVPFRRLADLRHRLLNVARAEVLHVRREFPDGPERVLPRARDPARDGVVVADAGVPRGGEFGHDDARDAPGRAGTRRARAAAAVVLRSRGRRRDRCIGIELF
eukprot:31304-Pelagococcus_subviridis.AAC.22